MAGRYGNGNHLGSNPNLSKEENILCSIDKKWERRDQFSNTELKKYTNAKRMRKPYNIRCRKHTPSSRLELTCSNCQERKPNADFSNSQRKEDDDRRRCRICVNFTETIDLFEDLSLRHPTPQRSVTGDVVARTSYEPLDNGPAPEPQEEPLEHAGVGGLAPENDGSPVAYGRGRNVGLTSKILDRDNMSWSSLGGDFTPAPSDMVSITSGEARHRRHRPQQYTAYGPDGQSQQRNASVITASVATSGPAIATSRSGWAKVKSRKTPIRAPDLWTYGNTDENGTPKRYDYSDSGSEDEC